MSWKLVLEKNVSIIVCINLHTTIWALNEPQTDYMLSYFSQNSKQVSQLLAMQQKGLAWYIYEIRFFDLNSFITIKSIKKSINAFLSIGVEIDFRKRNELHKNRQ